jgi:hypothetical protein
MTIAILVIFTLLTLLGSTLGWLFSGLALALAVEALPLFAAVLFLLYLAKR